MAETLALTDIVCIIVYFLLVVGVGLWSTFRPTKNSAAGYFLAGKEMHWSPIGASIFSSNIGARMFIGLAGAGAASGFAVAIYEWHAVFLLIALGWIFVPVYSACGAYTMPEYLKKRFGGVRLRILLSMTALIVYVIARLSTEIFSGSIFIQEILGWNIFASICGILLVTAVFTIAGGLVTVIYTDTLQTVILIAGATAIFFITLTDIGGWDAFMEKYATAAANSTLSDPINRSCGLPRADFMHIWRDPKTGDIPWTGAVFGLTTLGIPVWCTDQLIVQRCLAAKNLSHAKGGAVFAGLLKILPFPLFIVPGMISRIMFPDEVACSDPQACLDICGNEAGCSNIAYPLLVLRKLPSGVKGVMLAALLAALVSTLTSLFNSASSMMTLDIWRRFRRNARESELMVVGRLGVVVMTVFSVLWIPILKNAQGGELWTFVQAINACIAPPWCWVFLMAVFWKGTTEAGAFWGLAISTGSGIVRMVLQLYYSAPYCGSGDEDTRPSVLKDVHFLHFAIISSAISVVSTVAISLFTQKRTDKQLRRVTWCTRHDEIDPEEIDSKNEFEEEEDVDENVEDAIKESPPSVKPTFKSRFLYWLCGVDNKSKPNKSKEELAMLKKKMTDIHENPTAKKMTDFAAILSVILMIYLLGYFN